MGESAGERGGREFEEGNECAGTYLADTIRYVIHIM